MLSINFQWSWRLFGFGDCGGYDNKCGLQCASKGDFSVFRSGARAQSKSTCIIQTIVTTSVRSDSAADGLVVLNALIIHITRYPHVDMECVTFHNCQEYIEAQL